MEYFDPYQTITGFHANPLDPNLPSFQIVPAEQLPPVLYLVQHTDSRSLSYGPPFRCILAADVSRRLFTFDDLNYLAKHHAYSPWITRGPTRFISTFEHLERARQWAISRRFPKIYIISTGHLPEDTIVLRSPNADCYLFLHWIPRSAIAGEVLSLLPDDAADVEEYQHIREPVPGYTVHVPDPPCVFQRTRNSKRKSKSQDGHH